MISIMKDRDPKNEFINYIEEVEYNKIQNFILVMMESYLHHHAKICQIS